MRTVRPPCQPDAAPEPLAPVKPKYDDMTEAEQYAVFYSDRAAAIRQDHGMPPGAKFPPPDRDITDEIVTSNSPVFLALDAEFAAGGVAKSETPSLESVP
jgi:hypothetical protein